MQLEQQDRREARREKAIWHAMHRAAPKKPEAPVEQTNEKVLDSTKPGATMVRAWRWKGEIINSKGLVPELLYSASTLRAAGFKLPKLKKEEKK
jgi:hypothetical protein